MISLPTTICISGGELLASTCIEIETIDFEFYKSLVDAKHAASTSASITKFSRNSKTTHLMPNQYYIETNGRREGPYTAEQLRAHWNAGRIPIEAFYWQQGMEDWRSLREITPLLGSSSSPPPVRQVSGIRRAESVSAPMQKLTWVALRLTFVFAMATFFLPAISVNIPIFGAVEASVFEMLWPKEEPADQKSLSMPKPNFRDLSKSKVNVDDLLEKPGVLICSVAMLGLLAFYAMSLFWAFFGFVIRIRTPGLEAFWLVLACQYPLLMTIGGKMAINAMRTEMTRDVKTESDGAFAALGTAFMNNVSVAPGPAMWALMATALATLVLTRVTKPE